MRHGNVLLAVAVGLILASLLPLLAGCHGSSGTLAIAFSGDEIIGVWWYSGGVDDEGQEYTLAQLPYLQYLKITFRADGTYTVAYRYCEAEEVSDEGTWEFHAATQQFRSTSGMFGEQVLLLPDNRLEAHDYTGEWILHYIRTETTNACDRADPGRQAINGDWWYYGGEDRNGKQYTLADLIYLQYVKVTFNPNGTYTSYSKYCNQPEHVNAQGTWTFDPSTGQYITTGGLLGDQHMSVQDDRFEVKDYSTFWDLYFHRAETTNTCDRADPGRDAILGQWWYSGGMTPDGNEYTLADLAPLEYVFIIFANDGTYQGCTKVCGQDEQQADGGIWSFDPLTGTWVIESGFLGQGAASIKDGRLSARDWTGEWTLYHVRPETRNICD